MGAGGTVTDRAGERRSAVLVANGTLPEAAEPHLRTAVASSDLLIGVDGGARHLRRLGLLPDVITGDFDSLSLSEREAFAAEGVQIIPTLDQDYTDLDKAITVAVDDLGARVLRIFAATIGRLDHIYSALSTLIKHGRRADIRLVDDIGETWLIDRELDLVGEDLPGRVLSLLAFGPVTGITTTGVNWPLAGESLAPGVRDGTLNRITAERVTIRMDAGDLLVMVHHRDAAT
jgi:thiamine pyrophosphokinase